MAQRNENEVFFHERFSTFLVCWHVNSHPNKLPTPFFVSFKHKDKMMLIIANTRMIQFVVVLFTLGSFHSKLCGCACQAPCLRQTSTQTDSGPKRMVALSRRALPPLPLHCAQRSRLQAFCVYFMHETTQNKQGKRQGAGKQTR